MTNAWKHVLGLCSATAGAALLSVGASAQTNCNASVGPDVIVGDIQDIANYTAVGTTEALALGTYSCNIGTVWVNWISGNNQHPVIGGSIFRLKNVGGTDRFEQVGTGWLKHGFYALSNNLCCSGCQGTVGTHLGVHCSDPYTASRNGSQSGAGPRWQVNASTGVFTYPPASPGFSGSVARRIQVDTSDLEVTGGTTHYFGEAQYVTQDDATAGNKNNNASYRELSVSGSGSAWTFGLLASTVREKAAIYAWQASDPTVQINTLDIAGDGRFILADKVTSLGGGQFRYEYALHNLNSDLSGGSFQIPLPAGAVVTNIGFHDVTYHDGDGIGSVNQDGTDWTPTVGANSITWATTPFATNANANALRWGTLYNFRFDCNITPASGNATIGTFKNAGSKLITTDIPTGGGGPVGTNYCFGDGTSGTFCPCTNFGSAGNGCANSQNVNGANLSAFGTLSPDTVVLTSTGELPTALSIVLQGDTNAPAGIVFGDGLRCANGNLKRLYVKGAVGGVVTAPSGGDPSVRTQSANLGDTIPSGATRIYQVYYRDADPTFCPAPTGNTFNITNAVSIVWP